MTFTAVIMPGKTVFFMILTVAVRFGAESRVQGLPVFGWKMKKYFIYEDVSKAQLYRLRYNQPVSTNTLDNSMKSYYTNK